ncbi:MAG TPA: hypothetical protein VGL35_05825 [Rhizomicrobium sp.]
MHRHSFGARRFARAHVQIVEGVVPSGFARLSRAVGFAERSAAAAQASAASSPIR